MSLQFGFLWRVCTDVMAGITLLFNNHDHIGGREDRTDLLWVCCGSSHPALVAVLLFKPWCITPCLGWWLLFPPVPLQKGLVIPQSQPGRVVLTATIVMWSHLVCRVNECRGMHRKHLKGQGQWRAWINDHHLSGSFVQDTCPGYPSFPADNVLCILLSTCCCVCPELVQYSPATAPSDLPRRSSEQAAPSERSWKDRFGPFAHPAVCLILDNNFSHALIPAGPSCDIYVKQVALQSNDTTRFPVTPSFLPQANPSLLF